MQYLGDYRIDDYISFGAQLHRFSSGAVYAPTGNVTYTFYENNSTSGAPTGGNLAQLNSKTGLYTARVQLTAANGFEAGKEYLIHIEATVDSVAAAELLMFRVIANPKVDVDTIKAQTVTCAAGVTVLASVGTAATSTAQTGDAYARLGAPAGASVSADVAAVKNETAAILEDTGTTLPATLATQASVDIIDNYVDDLETRLTATRAGYLDNLSGGAVATASSIAALNNLSSAQAQAAATAALNAYDPPTNAEMEARTLVAANYATAAALDAVDNYIDTEVAAIKAVTDKLDTALILDGAAYQFTTNALENAPAGGGGGTADWTASEREQIRSALGVDGDKTAAIGGQLQTLASYVDTEVAAIKTAVDAIKLITDDLDVTAVTQIAASNAGQLTITAGRTFDEPVTGLVIPADWVTAIWTVKARLIDEDEDAVMQIRASNPGGGEDGLRVINGGAPGDLDLVADDGALTVVQADGKVQIFVSDEATVALRSRSGMGWDVKFIDANGDSYGTRGEVDVVRTETRTTE